MPGAPGVARVRRTGRRAGWPTSAHPLGRGCHSALTPPSGAPIVSLAMRRVLVGAAAIVTSLGWLQLAAAFGFPVTAPAAMLDRMLGAQREAGPAGWVLLLLGEAALAAAYFLVVEPRTRGVVPYRLRTGRLAAFGRSPHADRWLDSRRPARRRRSQ